MMDAGGFNAVKSARLFKPKDAYRMPGRGFQLPSTATVGRNPASGLVVYYALKAKPASDVVIEFLDANGKSIRKFTGRVPRPQPSPTPGATQTPAPAEQAAGEEGGGGGFPGAAARVSTDVGLNRFVWDMRYADAVRFPGMIMWAGNTRGPVIVPGTYTVKLTAGGQTLTQTFEVRRDPRVQAAPEDLAKQLDLAL